MFQIKIASKPLVLIAADDNGVAFDSGRPLGVGEQVALDRFVGGGLHLYYAPVVQFLLPLPLHPFWQRSLGTGFVKSWILHTLNTVSSVTRDMGQRNTWMR